MRRNLLSAIFLAILLLAALPCPFARSAGETDIRLTEVRGTVFKRGFVDWAREQWSDPAPAKQGDQLYEGMQIGTGAKSSAQVTWPNVTTRAWANSIYAIAPNQRLVFLLGGEMLYQLDKKRKGKADYFVWTKLIQARMRGTTVLFQNSGDTTRITVLEGCADILNRLDKSIIRIKPGVVIEVQEKSSLSKLASVLSSGTSLAPSNSTMSLQHIVKNVAAVKVFDTNASTTSILVADTSALLSHPLVVSLATPLVSLPLVQKSLGDLPNLRIDAVSISALVEIVAVPKTMSYRVGPLVGTSIPLPVTLTMLFPPAGLISDVGSISTNLTRGGASAVGATAGASLDALTDVSTGSLPGKLTGAGSLLNGSGDPIGTGSTLPGALTGARTLLNRNGAGTNLRETLTGPGSLVGGSGGANLPLVLPGIFPTVNGGNNHGAGGSSFGLTNIFDPGTASGVLPLLVR